MPKKTRKEKERSTKRMGEKLASPAKPVAGTPSSPVRTRMAKSRKRYLPGELNLVVIIAIVILALIVVFARILS